MSIQTNFRAQDMLGVAKPAAKKAAAPKYVPPVKKVEPVVSEPVVVVEEVVEVKAEEPSTEE